VSATRREFLLVGFFFALLAIVDTWPLARHMTTRVIGGPDGVDAWTGLYTLTWGIHSLANNPLQYFNSNNFYPHAESLAFGDHLFGQALLLAPIQWLLATPTLTYNVGVLLSFVVAGVGAYFLARQVTGSVAAGLTAGLLFGFSPWRFQHVGQLGVLALGGLPWAFLVGHLYLESAHRRLIYLAAFFAWFVAASSTVGAGYLIVAPIPLLIVILLPRFAKARERIWKHRGHLVVALGLFVVGMAPLTAPYLNHDLEQSLARQAAEGVAAPDTSGLASLKEGFFLALFTRNPEDANRPFNPGRVALVLLALLLVSGLLKPARVEREVIYYALLGGVALTVAAFTPVRTISLLSLAVALLGALAVRHVERWTGAVPGLAMVAWLVPLALTIDLHPGPPHVHAAIPREGPPLVATWLDRTGEAETVAEFPVAADDGRGDVWRARRQLASIYHWRRMLDGQARRTPPLTRLVRHRLANFPDQVSMAQLRSLSIDRAVVYVNDYDPPDWLDMDLRLAAWPELELEQDFGSARVYRLNWEPGALPAGMSR
jgi:hypothetical protein